MSAVQRDRQPRLDRLAHEHLTEPRHVVGDEALRELRVPVTVISLCLQPVRFTALQLDLS